MRESIVGVLPFGAVSDGGYRCTGFHVFVDSRSIEEASGETTSTDKLEVEMLPHMAEGHLRRMHVVFDRLCEHGLKLKPSKCEVFKSEINYLAHHMSRKGVLPSKKNLESIALSIPRHLH